VIPCPGEKRGEKGTLRVGGEKFPSHGSEKKARSVIGERGEGVRPPDRKWEVGELGRKKKEKKGAAPLQQSPFCRGVGRCLPSLFTEERGGEK